MKTSGDATNVNYYTTVGSYAKSLGMTLTVGNPGTDISENLVYSMDVFIINENPNMPSLSAFQGWHLNYPKSKWSDITYGLTTPVFPANMQTLGVYLGWVWLTDDVLPNPYDTIPSYFESEVSALTCNVSSSYLNYMNNASSVVSTYSSSNSNFTITWSDSAFMDKVYLENNFTGSLINTSMSGTYPNYYYNLTLGAGNYQYKFIANDTSGNSNSTAIKTFTIAKAKINVNVYLNGTLNANKSYTYPQSINATVTSSALTPSFYRDGVSKGTGEQILLGNGTYAYKVNASGNANYSDNSTGLTFYAKVNKGTSTINLWLNGTQGNLGYITNRMANLTAQTTAGLTVNISTNMTGWIEPTGTTTVYNITNMTEQGPFNITAYTNGNANYSSASVTYITTVVTTDTTLPEYSLNSTNSTFAGNNTMFSLYWTDNIALSGYIFSFDNCTGTLVNSSFVSMANPANWSNVTKRVNSTVGCTIRWKIYANDTANNWNTSGVYSYVTTQTDNAPRFSTSNVNSSLLGTPALFSLYWTDDVALSGYIFSFDNCIGTLTNDTFAAFSGTAQWSNATKVINSTVGCTIRWKVYANDSSNQWNTSGIYSFVNSCTEDWSCSGWTACSGSTQTRTCTDSNACGTIVNKPTLSQSCGGGGGGSPVSQNQTNQTQTNQTNQSSQGNQNSPNIPVTYLTMSNINPYLIPLFVPIFMFLLTALIKERRREKGYLYWGLLVSVIVAVILYFVLPLIFH